jgi:hypothetical protein
MQPRCPNCHAIPYLFRYFVLYLYTFVLLLRKYRIHRRVFPPNLIPLTFYLLELELPLPHDLHARTFERVHRSSVDVIESIGSIVDNTLVVLSPLVGRQVGV